MGERERVRVSGVRGWVVGEADADRTHEREDVWVLVVGGRSGREAGMTLQIHRQGGATPGCTLSSLMNAQ